MPEKISLAFKCSMRFFRTACQYESNSKNAILRHQKEIHEPEALEVNGFEPGYVEPQEIHVQQVAFNPYRVTDRRTQSRDLKEFVTDYRKYHS